MKLNDHDFYAKTVGILGFGVEGQATYQYLMKKGIKPFVFDSLERDDFCKKHPRVKVNEKFILGKDYLKQITKVEIIFKTPGIPVLWPEIQSAIRAGVHVTSQIEYFFDNCPGTIIGVTGTKGKGTTSSLIAKILKEDRKDVFLGGNIGVPAISFLDQIKKDSLVVLELSSYQLQSLEQSPQIAVVLNVTQDHLDYHQTVNEYQDAKKSIVRYQNRNEVAIINADYEPMADFIKIAKGETLLYSTKKATNGCYVDSQDNIILMTAAGPIAIARVDELLLRGRHNLENVMPAILASLALGVEIKVIQKSLKSFKGLEHRLELVGSVNKVTFYNDSFSTTPETAIAAIKSFTEPIILIAGGSSKKSNYHELGKVISKAKVKDLILIGETAEEIAKTIDQGFRGRKIFGLTKMAQIVDQAYELSAPGDVVLLSPACASFGLFENYKDRGEQYKKCIEKLLHK